MIKPSGIITLLTDFGQQDPFVGIMHGAILSRYQDLKIVDLSHQIPPQAIAPAAFWLAASYREFPEGTVHVAVVDPGVGTDRRILLADIDNHYFVVPDNGMLDFVCAAADRVQIRKLNRRALYLQRISNTFHGRDIFAPAAAEIASGKVWISELGNLTEDFERLAITPARRSRDVITGEILVIDHFGNLISNVPDSLLGDDETWTIHFKDQQIPLIKTYSAQAEGKPLALINAFDRLEIAVRNGRAELFFDAQIGQALEIKLKST